MAVVFEGFSIREYTAKMRAVDVVKCWPFTTGGGDDDPPDEEDEIKKQQVEALLPPITVSKFRWWSHELDKEIYANNTTQQQQDHKLGLRNEEYSEEEKLEMVCPVCGTFAAATVNAVNAHIDSCLAHAEREERRKVRMAMRAKSKAPKKRSIVEIFAVSPQIEKVDDVLEEDHDNLDEDDSGQEDHALCHNQLKQKKKMKDSTKKKMIKKVAIVNKLMMDKKKKDIKKKKMNRKKHKLKMMMMKRKKSNKGSNANKDNAHKLELTTPGNCSGKVYGSLCNKGFAKGILDDSSTQRKKAVLKCSAQKKHEVQTSKFIAKHQKTAIPVRSILKNHTKGISQKNSSICNMPGGSQPNCCDIQQSDRHVRFSGKDDILGPMKESFPFSDPNVCDTNADVCVSQLEQDQSTESDTELAAMEVNGSDNDVYVSTGNGTGPQSMISKKHLPDIRDQVNISNFLRPHVTSQDKEQHMSDKPSPPSEAVFHNDNLDVCNQGYHTAPLNPTYAGILRLLPAVKDVNNPCVSSQLCGSFPRASNPSRKFIDYFEDHTQGVAAVGSIDGRREFTQPSTSDITLTENENRRASFMSQSAIKSLTSQSLQYQPFYHLPPRELIEPQWKQREVALRERCMDKEFCGLPINSQGELIQASTSGRGGYNQPKKSTVISSSSRIPVHNPVLQRSVRDLVCEEHPIERTVPKDQLNLLTVQKKPNIHLPARLGVTDCPSTRRVDICPLNSDRAGNNTVYPLDLLNISLSQCRQYDQINNPKGNEMAHLQENSDNMLLKTTQPTMRLMGKDVAIGRSNTEVQRFEDGKIWMDKEIIQEHRPASGALDNSLLKTHIQEDRILPPAFGRPKGNVPQPFEIQSNQASQGNLLTEVSESRLPHPCFNWKNNVVFQNGDLAFNANSGSQLRPCAYPPSPPTMLYKAANLQEPFIYGAETVRINSQLPMRSTSADQHLHMGWRPTEITCLQNLPHATRSAFDFPFLHPDCSEHIQASSSSPSSSTNLPPWLLHASIQIKTPTMPSQNFSGVGSKHHPQTTGTRFLTSSPLQHSSVFSYPQDPVMSNLHLKNLCDPALFVRPPLVPFSPAINPNSSMNTGYRNRIKVKDRLKSKAFAVRLPDLCQKAKKRPAAIADDSRRRTKMPNMTQEDLSAVTELTRENLGSEMWHDSGRNELNSDGDTAIGMGCSPIDAQNDGLVISHGIETSKVDGTAKLGPIKLSAGAKHIFKPSKNMDQDNSRLIHSTIPFAAVTDVGNFLDPQKKSTKIYRF